MNCADTNIGVRLPILFGKNVVNCKLYGFMYCFSSNSVYSGVKAFRVYYKFNLSTNATKWILTYASTLFDQFNNIVRSNGFHRLISQRIFFSFEQKQATVVRFESFRFALHQVSFVIGDESHIKLKVTNSEYIHWSEQKKIDESVEILIEIHRNLCATVYCFNEKSSRLNRIWFSIQL